MSEINRAIDQTTFSQHVRDALAHLYDRLHLQDHPLVALLGVSAHSAPADALRRTLLDAVEQLCPPAQAPQRDGRWRQYRALRLRYVEGANPAEIAGRLKVSERQARRDHQEGVTAVAGLLWSRRVRLRDARSEGDGARGEGSGG
ncbi:MAG: hypothetical protein HYY04_14260, partial [Chloroflexi bacterium]|nr:hypothetical protein [Chloroflexota bacterium]